MGRYFVNLSKSNDPLKSEYLQNVVRSLLKKNPSRYLPVKDEKFSLFKFVSKKVLTADKEEIKENVRSRSSKLRYAIRNNNTFFNPTEFKNKFADYFQLEGNRI